MSLKNLNSCNIVQSISIASNTGCFEVPIIKICNAGSHFSLLNTNEMSPYGITRIIKKEKIT